MNAVIFGIDNRLSFHRLSFHTENRKNNFLVLGEGPADDNNDSVGTAEKKLNINLNKHKIFFEFKHYNCDESFLHVNKTEICKL